jgi:hypothetical protein
LREVVDGRHPAHVKEATPQLLARDSTGPVPSDDVPGPVLRQATALHMS